MADIESNLTPQKTFEKKLEDRIRSDIGDLMPDDLLQSLISRSIEKTFFQPQQITVKSNGNWGKDEIRSAPSVFEDIVEQAIGPAIESAIELWLVENNEKILQQVDLQLKMTGETILIRALQSLTTGALSSATAQLHGNLHQMKDVVHMAGIDTSHLGY